MNRRAAASWLMVALICGGPLHAAGRPAWAVAWVELPALSPSRLAALCQSLRGLPVHLRALEGGGMVRLEVSAAREDQLAAALDRLQRAARAAKVKFRVVAGGWSAPVWDVSGRPLGVHRSRRAAWPAPPAAENPSAPVSWLKRPLIFFTAVPF